MESAFLLATGDYDCTSSARSWTLPFAACLHCMLYKCCFFLFFFVPCPAFLFPFFLVVFTEQQAIGAVGRQNPKTCRLVAFPRESRGLPPRPLQSAVLCSGQVYSRPSRHSLCGGDHEGFALHGLRPGRPLLTDLPRTEKPKYHC